MNTINAINAMNAIIIIIISKAAADANDVVYCFSYGQGNILFAISSLYDKFHCRIK